MITIMIYNGDVCQYMSCHFDALNMTFILSCDQRISVIIITTKLKQKQQQKNNFVCVCVLITTALKYAA